VAFSGDGDELGVVQEAIEDGAGGGDVLQQLAPVLEGAVAGHDGRAVFVTSHNEFQEVFASVLVQLLQAHVVADEKVGIEVATQETVALGEGFLGGEIGDQIKDRAVPHKGV